MRIAWDQTMVEIPVILKCIGLFLNEVLIISSPPRSKLFSFYAQNSSVSLLIYIKRMKSLFSIYFSKYLSHRNWVLSLRLYLPESINRIFALSNSFLWQFLNFAIPTDYLGLTCPPFLVWQRSR